jgi:adenylosuccinate synthase
MENLAIVGLQWGDEGKGKLVDYLTDRYDAVVRYNGGSNAGHTVVFARRRHTFHLVPSGALKGRRLIIGAGVALDPEVLSEELSLLRDQGVKVNLLVDGRCTLVSPLEKGLDALIEEVRGSSALGTTRRGIGPSYAMRAFRLAPRAADLSSGFDMNATRKFCQMLGVSSAGLDKWITAARRTLKGRLGDAGAAVMEVNESGGGVLFEGSQGTLLDLLHGSYPYVTSTHTLASYIPASLGMPNSCVGRVVGVTKCYATRVGAGPFPSEIKGTLGEALRAAGNEYGATTGRPRRFGWLDLVALRYSIGLNDAREIAVTKVDVMSRFREFKVCVAYRFEGSETTDFQNSLTHLEGVEPVYETPLSLHGSTFGSTSSAGLRDLIDFLEERLRVRVKLVSFGEERSKTIEL